MGNVNIDEEIFIMKIELKFDKNEEKEEEEEWQTLLIYIAVDLFAFSMCYKNFNKNK